jgi:hypothetical protein
MRHGADNVIVGAPELRPVAPLGRGCRELTAPPVALNLLTLGRNRIAGVESVLYTAMLVATAMSLTMLVLFSDLG